MGHSIHTMLVAFLIGLLLVSVVFDALSLAWPIAAAAALAVPCALASACLVLMTAWMGGERGSRLGIGVSPHAHPDAASSMQDPVEATSPSAASAQSSNAPWRGIQHRP